jgi:hypothetical protein
LNSTGVGSLLMVEKRMLGQGILEKSIMMTENELKDFGFDQVVISDVDSGNGYDYYFYQKELYNNVVLYTSDSIDTKDDRWIISCWDLPAIKIESVDHYQQFLDTLRNIIR